MRNFLVAALALSVAACGGGSGGGVNSTDGGSSGGRGSSYETIDQMLVAAKDQTFKTAAIKVNLDFNANPVTRSVESLSFGSQLTIQYIANLGASGTYRLTGSDGETADFAPGFAVEVKPGFAQMRGGMGEDVLVLGRPVVNGVPLNYTMFGFWGHPAGYQAREYFAVGGSETKGGDMPRSGSASYDLTVDGFHIENAIVYNVAGASDGSLTADFASQSVSVNMNIGSLGYSNGDAMATLNGNGAIAANSPAFSGSMTGSNGETGLFSGSFFGPNAAEVGFAWYYSGAGAEGKGFAAGRK